MNPGVTIRKYAASDLPHLKEVFFSNVPVYFDETEWPEFEEFLAVDILEYCYYDVVLLDGLPVGAGGIAKNEENQVHLCWGMIRSDLHKRGLGKLLLEKRLKLAEELYPGCPVVVSTSQHAYSFFEKYGFETLRTEQDHWAKGLHLYDMRKR